MADLKNILEENGLSRKESEIYLALLKVGETGATRLSSLTNINRITLYGILEGLKEKGFVITTKKDKKTNFVPVEPKKILGMLKQKQFNFSAAIEDFDKISNTNQNKSSVKLYEGEKGVTGLMAEIFGSGKQVYSFGNMDIPEEKYFFSTANLRKMRIMAGTKIKGVTNRLPKEDVKRKEWKKTTEARVLKDLDKISTWTYIWEGKVANISYKKGLIGEVIEDEEFANTMMFLWEGLWGKAKTI